VTAFKTQKFDVPSLYDSVHVHAQNVD